jgi:hypothetical protein
MGGTATAPTIGAINVTGTVNLAGRLTVTSHIQPASQTVLTIIHNLGSSAVVGTFANLPEGSTIVVNGVTYKISYLGNGGHDVTLTAQ